jgi:FkbM family methyltransferase
VDAGSHAGYFSLIAASKASNGEIFSFEPDDNNYNYIKSVKEINGISHWRVENKGLGEEAGELKFRRGPSSSMGKIADDGKSLFLCFNGYVF